MQKQISNATNSIRIFSDYIKLTGLAHTGPEPAGEPGLLGKRLGIINGSSWITLWSNYFGRMYLPGVHLINVGNEAVQINFMQAHQAGMPTPPQSNIDTFVRYAHDLLELSQVDMILITCSTMNRAYPQVQQAMNPYRVPVVQIDQPMMSCAVEQGGHVLVVATHGPTVRNTQELLRETAKHAGIEITFSGVHDEIPWHHLAQGDVEMHNRTLAKAIKTGLSENNASCVVLAQLSMSVLLLSYPDPEKEFGVPVYTSGHCGFEEVRKQLLEIS